LRVFVAVAEHLHVTRAANALNITQSAASAAIAAMERRHNVQLFHRVGRRIEMTDAGKLFVEEARKVLSGAAAAEHMLTELAGFERGSLAIGASQTIANYWLPPLLGRYRQTYPKIALQIAIANTAQVAQAVLAGDVDVGYVEGVVDREAIVCEPLEGDRLTLVVGRSHPWAGRASVSASEFRKTSWILREPGSGTRGEFLAGIAKFGLSLTDLEVLLELPSNEAVRAAVATGLGATVISDLVVAEGIRSGALSAIDFPFGTRPFFALESRDRSRKRAVDMLLDLAHPGRESR
jgi:DNA-binding transcriptional LysR family regulator